MEEAFRRDAIHGVPAVALTHPPGWDWIMTFCNYSVHPNKLLFIELGIENWEWGMNVEILTDFF